MKISIELKLHSDSDGKLNVVSPSGSVIAQYRPVEGGGVEYCFVNTSHLSGELGHAVANAAPHMDVAS